MRPPIRKTRSLDEPQWRPIDTLISTQPWSVERVLALPGRCRGVSLSHWAANCERRWGSEAIPVIRAALGEVGATLPDDPPNRRWFPLCLQVRLTDILIEHFLQGDAMALEAMAIADARRAAGWAGRLALRRMGPGHVFVGTARLHRWLMDVGQAEARLEGGGRDGDGAEGAGKKGGRVELRWTGAAVFENPTWRLLQVFAMRGVIEGAGREVRGLEVQDPGVERFAIRARWE